MYVARHLRVPAGLWAGALLALASPSARMQPTLLVAAATASVIAAIREYEARQDQVADECIRLLARELREARMPRQAMPTDA